MQIAKMNAMLVGTAKGFKEAFSEAAEATRSFADESTKDFSSFRSAAERYTQEAMTPIEKLEAKLMEVQSLGAKGWISPEVMQRNVAKITGQIGQINSAAQAAKDAEMDRRINERANRVVQILKQRKAAQEEITQSVNRTSTAQDEEMGRIKRIQSMFGRGSTFKEGLEILLGGGAIAGLAMGANAVANLSNKIADLNNLYTMGKISSSDYTAELLKSVPIIGNLADALANLAISWLPAQKTFLQSQAAISEMFAQDDRAKAAGKAQDQLLKQITSTTAQDKLAAMADGVDKSLEEIRQRYEKTMADIAAARKENEKLDLETGRFSSREFFDAQQAALARYEAEMQRVIQATRDLNTETEAIRLMQEEAAKAQEDGVAKAIEDGVKAYDDLIQQAQRYYDATRTPAEKYAAEIEKINELLLSGALDPETAQRAADAAAKTLKEAQKTSVEAFTDQGGPQLLQAGSQGAASLVAKLGREQFAKDQTEKMVEEQQTTNETLAAIRAANEKLADSIATVELL